MLESNGSDSNKSFTFQASARLHMATCSGFHAFCRCHSLGSNSIGDSADAGGLPTVAARAIADAVGGGILAAATLGMRRLGDLASGMMGLAVRLGRPAASATGSEVARYSGKASNRTDDDAVGFTTVNSEGLAFSRAAGLRSSSSSDMMRQSSGSKQDRL